MFSKVITGMALPMVRFRGTSGAGFQFELPACEAVITTTPAPMMVMVVPLAPVQVAMASSELVNVTGLPELPPVAETVNDASPNVLEDKEPNVIA